MLALSLHLAPSLNADSRFSPSVGSGSVIEGWQLGLGDMCIGEKRKLIIPPALGYGDKGIRATIPPMATLVFETELLAINGNDGRKAEQKEGKKEEL